MNDTSANRLRDRVAVVTGASRGIGRSIALKLASEGAHVILVARTVAGLETLDDEIQKLGSSATLVPLDLTDFDALDRLGGSIHERWGKLDIFVGNAGVLGEIMPIAQCDPKIWQEVMDVNVTANARLIRSFDPLLKVSDAGRVVLVTSGVAKSLRAFWGPYSISKAAVNALAITYANETLKTNLRVNLVNPGPIRTRMRANAMPGEDPETLPHPDEVAELFLELCLPSCERHGEIVDFKRG